MSTSRNSKNRKSGNTHRHRPVHNEGELQFTLSDFQGNNTPSHLCPLSMKKKQRWLINSKNVSDKAVCLDALLDDMMPQRDPLSIIMHEPSKNDVKKVSKFVVLRRSTSSEHMNEIYKDYQLLENRNQGNVGNLTKSAQQTLDGQPCIQVQTIRPGVPLNPPKSQPKKHSGNVQNKVQRHYFDEEGQWEEFDDEIDSDHENPPNETHKTSFYRQPKVKLMQQIKLPRDEKGNKQLKMYVEDDLSQEKNQDEVEYETLLSSWSCGFDHLVNFYGNDRVHKVSEDTISIDLSKILLNAESSNANALQVDLTLRMFPNKNESTVASTVMLNVLWKLPDCQLSLDWLSQKAEWNVHEIIEEIVLKLQYVWTF